jgi:hypothetical protein
LGIAPGITPRAACAAAPFRPSSSRPM